MGDIANELTALGYEGEAHDRAKGFLEKVGIVKEKFFIVDARGEAEVSGLPTIDEMSLVWDIRPIFESVDWSPNEKGDGPVTAVWLAHSNMLILEIMSSNREGKKESLSVQLSEDEFRELERLVGVARKQLDVIHAKRFI